MAWWTALVGPALKAVTELVDDLHMSGEEKARAKIELVKLEGELKQKADELELKYEEELTKRHAADMASTSWLSKNIRPLSLVFLILATAVFAVFDGNIGDFTIDTAYISMYESLLLLAFGFYFGSRGLEKVASIVTAMKTNRK